MAEEIEVHLLDAARIIVPDQSGREIVFHLRTVNGHDFHFGASLDDAARLVVQWFYNIRDVHEAVKAGTAISGDVEVLSKPTVN